MTLPYENSTSGERALGEWTVLERTGRKWLCRCSCGRESLVDKYQLRNGGSTRCKSCANKGRAFTHGQAGGDIVAELRCDRLPAHARSRPQTGRQQ